MGQNWVPKMPKNLTNWPTSLTHWTLDFYPCPRVESSSWARVRGPKNSGPSWKCVLSLWISGEHPVFGMMPWCTYESPAAKTGCGAEIVNSQESAQPLKRYKLYLTGKIKFQHKRQLVDCNCCAPLSMYGEKPNPLTAKTLQPFTLCQFAIHIEALLLCTCPKFTWNDGYGSKPWYPSVNTNKLLVNEFSFPQPVWFNRNYDNIPTYKHTNIHTCIHTCIHTYIHACIHT